MEKADARGALAYLRKLITTGEQGRLFWASLPHGAEDSAFINRPGKAAVSTRRSLAAELSPLSSH